MGKFGHGSYPAKMPNKRQTSKLLGVLLSDLFDRPKESIRVSLARKGKKITNVEDVTEYIRSNTDKIKKERPIREE